MASKTVLGRRAFAVVMAVAVLLVPSVLRAQEGDPYTLQTMQELNEDLKALWMDVRIEQIEFLKKDRNKHKNRIWEYDDEEDADDEEEDDEEEHSGGRLHSQPFRWVAYDVRRNADGTKLTYLVDQDGLASGAAEVAIDRAASTWASRKCLRKTDLGKRADTGADPDLFDGLLGYGSIGDHRLGGIVHAGWMPPDFFDAVGGPGTGETVLAFSVTFIYVGADGEPTDVDDNGYFDVATSEIYYNEAFAWTAGGGGYDIESVALHEIGHSLSLGHADPDSDAVMNPVYSGVNRSVQSEDNSVLCSVWAKWPN